MATRGGGVQEIRPGDVVYIEPGEEHWHGATPDRFMAHVAIQEADENGDVVTWLDHVTDERVPSLTTARSPHAPPSCHLERRNPSLTCVYAGQRRVLPRSG